MMNESNQSNESNHHLPQPCRNRPASRNRQPTTTPRVSADNPSSPRPLLASRNFHCAILGIMSNSGDKSRSKRRREAKLKQRDDALEREYAEIKFVKRPSSGRPATPHRHFESSYEGRTTTSASECGQVIHRHANGLCVVTAGGIIKKACSKSDSSCLVNAPL